MSVTIKWSIDWMQCAPQENSYTDVVITAQWRCSGVDGDFNSTIYGTCAFPPPVDTFTPYSDLTQDQVLQWCWSNGVDKVEKEALVASEVQEQISPKVIELPLPWA